MSFIFDIYDYINTRQNRFYYLSLIKENGVEWYIHGLWPQYTPDKYPTYCKPVEFNVDKLFPIMPALEKYWCSDREEDVDFWRHEWQKHGSCMFQTMDELEYFQTTLRLYAEAIKLGLDKKYGKGDQCLIPVTINLQLNLDS